MEDNKSLYIKPLEDKQLISIVIDSNSNGTEYEFQENILAKQFIFKGYSFYSTLIDPISYSVNRGHFTLSIEWLKTNGITKFNNGLTRELNNLMLPFHCGQSYKENFSTPYVTSNLNMNFNITLPSQTSMRKRFKATVLSDSAQFGEEKLDNLIDGFRLVIYIEVVHTHIHI